MLIIDDRRLQLIAAVNQHRVAAAADPHPLIAQRDLNPIAAGLRVAAGEVTIDRMPFGDNRRRLEPAQIALLPFARIDTTGCGFAVRQWLRREVNIQLVARELIARAVRD